MSLFDVNSIEYFVVGTDNLVSKSDSKAEVTQFTQLFAVAELQIGTTPGSSGHLVPYKKLIFYNNDGATLLTSNGYRLEASYCYQGEGDGFMQINHYHAEVLNQQAVVSEKDYKLNAHGIQEAIIDFKRIAKGNAGLGGDIEEETANIKQLKSTIEALSNENRLLKKKIQELAKFARKLQ